MKTLLNGRTTGSLFAIAMLLGFVMPTSAQVQLDVTSASTSFENYYKHKLGTDYFQSLHPRLHVLDISTSCRATAYYDPDDAIANFHIKVYMHISINKLHYFGKDKGTQHTASLSEITDPSRFRAYSRARFYLDTRFGRTKAELEYLTLSNGETKELLLTNYLLDVWRASKADLKKRGNENPTNEEIYRHLQPELKIESFSNPNIQPENLIIAWLEKGSADEAGGETPTSSNEPVAGMTSAQRSQLVQQNIQQVSEAEQEAQQPESEPAKKTVKKSSTSSSGDSENSTSSESQKTSSANIDEQAYREELERVRQEEERKREEVRQNQQHYDALKQQSYDNSRDAAAMSAAALLVHYYLGKVLYKVDNTSYKSIYRDWAPRTRMTFGYGLSIHSLQASFNNLERNSGSTSHESRLMNRPTIDLSFNLDHWSVTSSNFGLGYHFGLSAGHGFLFETYKLRSDLGIKTHLGPLVFNTYSEFGRLNFNTWIDPTEEAEEKIFYVNSKVETGVRFGKNGNDHNLLLVIQRPMISHSDKKLGFGGKYEGGSSNGLRFIAEFISLPSAYGGPAPEDAGAAFQLNLGVYKSLDWYQKPFINNYDKRALYKANRDKTWFVATNAKLTYGSIYMDDFGEYLQRLRPNLEFQVLVEKNIHIRDGWYANVGGGTTLLRRFDVRATSVLASGMSSSKPLSVGKLTLDFPIGVLYTFKPKTKDDWNPWLAFNSEMVVNLANLVVPGYHTDEGREYITTDRAETLKSEQKLIYPMLQLGMGVDYYYNLSKRLRWGLYYQLAPFSVYQTWGYHPHGIVFSVKYSI